MAWRLFLLGGWRLERDGVVVPVTRSAQRLIALLALRGPTERALVIDALWPEAPEARGATNLRSALHRVRDRLPGLILTRRDTVCLTPAVRVDVDVLSSTEPNAVGDSRCTSSTEATLQELLPGWYEDWVLTERERTRQLSLHVTEHRAVALAEKKDFERALYTALLVTRAEPMRESAQRLVVRIHLAEGNVSEAIRTYSQYADLMHRELGVRPTTRMTELVAGVAPQVVDRGLA